MRFVASCRARSRPRVAGTPFGVLFAGWPAPVGVFQNGTIVANPRRRRVAVVASFRCVDSSSSNPSLYSLQFDTAEPRPRTRSRARRLESFVEESTQRVHLHHAQWDRKNSAISRFPTCPAVVFSTRSTSSSSLAFTFSLLISKNINAASKPTRLFPSTNG